jgi:hypothetical protein
LRVDVKNIISESHILYSIDIEQQYLEKVEIVSAEPTPDSIGQSGGFVSYNFNTQLKSPSEITIRFKMKALSPTLGFGDLGIFLDDEKGEYRLAIPTTVVASE